VKKKTKKAKAKLAIPKMRLEQVPLNKLLEWKQNPRENNEAAGKLSKLIEAHGYRVPIIVDKNKVIRAGHTRLKALKRSIPVDEHKNTKIPVLIQEFKNDKEAVAFSIADNRSAEWSLWDLEGLSKVMNDLLKDDKNLLFSTGFTAAEISSLMPDVDLAGIEASLKDTPPELADPDITGDSDNKAEYIIVKFDSDSEYKAVKKAWGMKPHSRVIEYQNLLKILRLKKRQCI